MTLAPSIIFIAVIFAVRSCRGAPRSPRRPALLGKLRQDGGAPGFLNFTTLGAEPPSRSYSPLFLADVLRCGMAMMLQNSGSRATLCLALDTRSRSRTWRRGSSWSRSAGFGLPQHVIIGVGAISDPQPGSPTREPSTLVRASPPPRLARHRDVDGDLVGVCRLIPRE